MELLDWDMGLGLNHKNFLDEEIPDDAPDLVNFDVSLGLVDQTHILGLGQINAPTIVHHHVESNGAYQEVLYEQEEIFQAGAAINGPNLFPRDPHLDDID